MKKPIAPLSAQNGAATGVSAAAMATMPLQMTYAASNDGSLVGRDHLERSKVAGRHRDHSAQSRNGIHTHGQGRGGWLHRFPFPARRQVHRRRHAQWTRTLGKLTEVTVGLGSTTTADVTVNVSNVEEIFRSLERASCAQST